MGTSVAQCQSTSKTCEITNGTCNSHTVHTSGKRIFPTCYDETKNTFSGNVRKTSLGNILPTCVVRRYKTVDRPDAWQTCFLQLKKRGKGTLTDAVLMGTSKKFSLKSYVDSFLHIKCGMSANMREEILNGSLEDCLFVLYTNVHAEGELLGRKERGSLGELGNLLLEPEGTVLGFEEGRDAVIFAALEGMGAEGFLERMKVFPGQPTPGQLETVVKCELRLISNVSEAYLDALYERYERLVAQWWESSNDLLDETSNLYDLALDEARLRCVNILSSHEITRACVDVGFRDSADPWMDEGGLFAMVHIIAPEPCLRSSVTKLLRSDGLFSPGSFAFFDLKCLELELDTILPVWRSNGNLRWLVVLSTSSEDCCELSDKICEVLLENKDKRIAVVSQRGDNFTSYLKGKLCDDYKEIEDDCRVSQLDEETLAKLRAMSVSFQGVTLAAESFFSDKGSLLEDIALDDCLAISLMSRNTHCIGHALPKVASYYISRTLLNPVLRDDLLHADKTKGGVPVDELREHVDPTFCLQLDVDQCFDVPQRCVLVTGEPGMGKTTLASHLARRTKEARPLFWVVYVNLPKHSRLLEQTSDPIEFLSTVAGVDRSPFHTSLLRQSVGQTGNVAVLLDAFDEISPKYESHGLCLISALLRTKVDRVWVTSRFFVQVAVEREMSTLAMGLQDFTMENQMAFLASFWRDSVACEDSSDIVLNDLIAKLLARVSESLTHGERLFTGIPLQTMMLAEVFSNYAANPSAFPLPKKLDLIYLFEEFIEKKFMIYVRKLLPDTNTNDPSPVLDDMKTCFSQKHMNASLVYLFNSDFLQKLDSKDEIVRKTNEFTSRVLSGEDKTGIVDGLIYERPRFVHRCFAEFFAAKFFIEHYKRNRDFLRKYLHADTMMVVRKMMDGLLARCRPLHQAVIQDDLDLAKKCLRKGSSVNEADNGGRSPLHLAAGYNLNLKNASLNAVTFGMPSTIWGKPGPIGPRRQQMVELLLENGADVNAVDHLLEWTALEYAVGASSWDAAETLLAAGSNPGRIIFPVGVNSFTLWSSIIDEGHVELMKCILGQGLFAGDGAENQFVVQRLIINGHVTLVRLLIKNSEDVLIKRLEGRTLLHQAARCGQIEILDYLIDVLKREVGDNGCAEGINLPDDSGATAMYLAAENGFLDIVRLLTKSGGDSKFLAENCGKLLLRASHNGDLDLLKFVIESIGDDAQLLKSCLDSTDGNGMTGLILAAFSGRTNILRYLVEKGGDVTLLDNYCSSALHAAIGNGSLTDVTIIIGSLGDDKDAVKRLVNMPSESGMTSMHYVTCLDINSRRTSYSFEGQAKIAEYLISRGADVRSIDKYGSTPLHWAASRFACLPVAKVMVQSLGNDADAIISYINTMDIYGRTAKDVTQDNETNNLFSSQEQRVKFAYWLDSVLEVNMSFERRHYECCQSA